MRLIIVEDEKNSRKGLMNLALALGDGIKVIATAPDGKAGYDVIMRLAPDVVITDIRMPRMDGMEMIAALKESGATCRYIVVSAYADFDYAKRCISLGVREYILKPVAYADIRQALRRLSSEQDAFRGCGEHHEAPDRLHPAILKVTEIVRLNYAQPLSVEGLAESLHMTPEYLCTLFHKEMKRTFSSYLKEIRLCKARELLDRGGLKIYEIAEAVGYHDSKYFAKVFKETMGISARDYIRRGL